MDKVYCIQCRHFLNKDAAGEIWNECEYPFNVYVQDSWIAPQCVGYIKKPKEINANNDCPYFEQYQDLSDRKVPRTKLQDLTEFISNYDSELGAFLAGVCIALIILVLWNMKP